MHIDPFSNYTPEAKFFSGKTILIFGATGAIGQAIAQSCAQLGCQLILSARSPTKLAHLANTILEPTTFEPALFPLDFSAPTDEQINLMVSSISDQFGKIDGLVHCTSIIGSRTLLSQYNKKTWEQVMNVNLTSQFIITQALLPLIEKSTTGSIVFTSSTVGREGRAYWGAYSVSKFAIEGLTQVLGNELFSTTGIRVNCINPGPVASQLRTQAYPAEDPNTVKQPKDVVNPYLYLLDAQYPINAQSIG